MKIYKLSRDEYERWGRDPEWRKVLSRRLCGEHTQVQIRNPAGKVLKVVRDPASISERATSVTPPQADVCSCRTQPDRCIGHHHPSCIYFADVEKELIEEMEEGA